MSKRYFIHKENAANRPVVIFSTSSDSPINHLTELENDLKGLGVRGEVVFDLLLSNGNNHDRFYKAVFDGVEFIVETLKRLKSPTVYIKKTSLEFYHAKQQYFSNSILSKPQQFLFRKKILK